MGREHQCHGAIIELQACTFRISVQELKEATVSIYRPRRPLTGGEGLPMMVTPRLMNKRRLAGDGESDRVLHTRSVVRGASSKRKRFEERPDDDDQSAAPQTALDEMEEYPCISSVAQQATLQANNGQRLRARLRNMGWEAFVKTDVLTPEPKQPLRTIGQAFGMDPNSHRGDDRKFAELLVRLIQRTFYKREKLTQYNTIDDVVELLQRSANILVITGAGISTSLGIPDFRSTNSGFYKQVRSLGLEDGQDLLDINNFDNDPEGPRNFYQVANMLLPFGPCISPTHAFIRLLQDKNKLQTNYTQNIDNLEWHAGIDKARLVHCHGSFATASCRKCGHQVTGRAIEDDIRAKHVPQCKECLKAIAAAATRSRGSTKIRGRKLSKAKLMPWEDSSEDDETLDVLQPGIMKPDIVFFGEQLPPTFFDRFDADAKKVDLVLVIATSLKVKPVSEMPDLISSKVPQIYISRAPVEHIKFDVQLLGDCDHVIIELCRRAGWDLKHDRVPEGFRAEIQRADESGCRWAVRSKIG